MAKDGGNTILLLGAAGVAVYGWYQGWFSGLFGSTAATTTTAAATTPATTTSAVATVPTTTAVAVEPATITQVLTSTPPPTATMTLAKMLSALQTAEKASYGGDPALSSSASNPVASYDVHNWYLTNRANVGVADGQLQAPDHTTQLSLTDYWAWAAPQLQAQTPGLSGLGNVYADLAALARERRGW